MLWIWVGFITFVLLMLALDLGVFHRHSHVVRVKEALAWSGVWLLMGLSFSIFVYHGYENHWLGLGSHVDAVDGLINNGRTATLKYLTGYVVEKSLSVDNIFVIALIFSAFAVPPLYQHKVLFWGVLGALVFRGIMIGLGAKLVSEFHWILYVFGAFLILTAIKMLMSKDEIKDPRDNKLVKFVKKYVPVTDRFHRESFFVRAGSAASHSSATPGEAEVRDEVVERAKPGTLLMTPLMLALIMVEVADLIFAVDSIPAIFAITADPFLVFTSNVFAILGLRSLYFALADMLDRFHYLKPALAVVLIVVGIKIMVAKQLKAMMGDAFNFYVLGLVLAIIATGVIVSLVKPKKT